MNLKELQKLDDALDAQTRDFLPGFGPKLNVRVVESFHSSYYRRSKKSVYADSILEVLGVEINGAKSKVFVVGKDGKSVTLNYQGLRVTDEPVEIYYKGMPLAEFLERESKLEEIPDLFDVQGNPVNIGDKVAWQQTAGDMQVTVIVRMMKNIRGNITLVMDSGSEFARDTKNLIVVK